MDERLYLMPPTWDKGWFLIFESNSPNRLAQFRSLGFSTLPRELRWFLQLDGPTAKGFEFWTDDYPAIEKAAQALSHRLGMRLELPSSIE